MMGPTIVLDFPKEPSSWPMMNFHQIAQFLVCENTAMLGRANKHWPCTSGSFPMVRLNGFTNKFPPLRQFKRSEVCVSINICFASSSFIWALSFEKYLIVLVNPNIWILTHLFSDLFCSGLLNDVSFEFM